MLPIVGFVLSIVIAATGDTYKNDDYRPGKIYYFHTSDRDVDNDVGDVEGNLAITISTDGTVRGTFRPVDGARLIDVHGSLKGDQFSLYIGVDGSPIRGVLRNGRIVAHVLENDREHSFVGSAEADRR